MAQKILIVAAHPDDDILGCGATMAKHAAEGATVKVLFIADGEGAREKQNLDKRKDAAAKALQIVGATIEEFLDFPDNQLDTVPLLSIVQKIEKIVKIFQPEIIYTHHHGDLNIDHSLTHRAVMTACRPLPECTVKAIYAFEVLSSTEWADEAEQFKPNHFVDVQKYWDKKIKALSEYKTEIRKFPHSRSLKNLDALSTYRGGTAGIKRAEAFQLIRSLS